MPADLAGLLADLAAETAVLDSLVARLDEARWRAPTPAPGWSIHDQVTHLAYFDETAAQAAADPDGFRAGAAELMRLGGTFPDEIARRHAALPPAGALAWFRRARAGYLATFRGLDPRQRLPWYGPDMSAASSVTARLMETWAHGQDIADTLGVWRPPSARLRHVAHLGVSTFYFTFQLNARAVPVAPVRVELTGPDEDRWTWGPAGAADRVTGPALDFCLAVTQRRHLDDLALDVTGPVAAEWMSIAQAFAGPPGQGRKPGMRVPGEHPVKRPVRIGNCSGFYGDRIEAAREMVDGGPIDVLTGDYLAELTMLILWKARQKDPDAGYARTFLTQLEQVLGSCLDRGIKIVSNAGGLNPAGLAARIGELAARLGLAPRHRLGRG